MDYNDYIRRVAWWRQPFGPDQAAALIHEARIRAFLTQDELAERIGISQTTISRWEHGTRQPRFTDVMKVLRGAGFWAEIHLNSTDRLHAGSLWIHQIRAGDAAADIPRRQRRFKVSRARRYVPYDGPIKGPHLDRDRRWWVEGRRGVRRSA